MTDMERCLELNANKLRFESRAIHEGNFLDTRIPAVNVPIYVSSKYIQNNLGAQQEYQYGRNHNATRAAYEQCIANLESGNCAYAFASGVAAAATILDFLQQNSHVIVSDQLHQGNQKLFGEIKHHSSGLKITYVDLTDLKKLQSSIQPNTKMVWAESPSNPLLKIIDLSEVARIAKENHLVSVIDNTLASPWIQRPLEYGFDVVVHSATKCLSGHSDVIGGVVVVGDNPELGKILSDLHNALGAIASPFDSYLMLRGIRTLALRMERHCNNAMEIANYLENHPKISRVLYPGLKTHPQYHIVKKQMKHFGGVISIYYSGNQSEAVQFLKRLQLFKIAEGLGGVESLISLPALMSHAHISSQKRLEIGIEDNLIRISVGIEDVQDLLLDLKQALNF